MNKISLSLFILFICTDASAQINISVGKSFYPITSPGFETFFRTYNVAIPTLATPFASEFDAAKGWSIRGGYLINRHDDGVGFYYNSTTGVSRVTTNNIAEFPNGEKRKLELRVRDWNTDVSLGVGGNNFHIAVNGSVALHDNKLLCSYIFSNGDESFGLDHYINGIFSASRLTGGYGGEVGIGIKYLQVVFKAHKVYKPFQKDGSTYLDYYDDLVTFKEYTGLTASYPTQYFPADYNVFVADQLTSESSNNIVYINDRGWQYTLSLMFIIPSNR